LDRSRHHLNSVRLRNDGKTANVIEKRRRPCARRRRSRRFQRMMASASSASNHLPRSVGDQSRADLLCVQAPRRRPPMYDPMVEKDRSSSYKIDQGIQPARRLGPKPDAKNLFALARFPPFILQKIERDRRSPSGQRSPGRLTCSALFQRRATSRPTKDAGRSRRPLKSAHHQQPTAAALAYGPRQDQDRTIAVIRSYGGGHLPTSRCSRAATAFLSAITTAIRFWAV